MILINRRTALTAITTLTLTACAPRSRQPGPRVYVTNETSGDLTVIDERSQAVVATVPLGKRPRGIQVSPDKRFLYVALSGSPIAGPGVDESKLPPPDRSADGIGVVEIATQRLTRVLHAGTDPEQLALSPDGARMYVANEDAALVSILDSAKGSVIGTVPVGEEPEGVGVRPDGRVVYVTSEAEGSIYAIDTQSHAVLAKIAVGRRPRSIAFLANGTRAYVTLETDAAVALVDATEHRLLTTIRLGNPLPVTPETVRPMGLAVAPDESAVYVTAGRNGGVFIIDPAKSEAVGSIKVGERPWGVAVTPDGRRLYTANGPSNDVSVVDLVSRQVMKKIAVGQRPWGVVVVEG